MTKKEMKTEFVVGMFVMAVLAVFFFMTFMVGGIEFTKKKGYIVYVHFKNIAGLDKKTKVMVAGVVAGTIEAIDLADGQARLTIRMYPGVKLYSDAVASIKPKGLLGEKYLSVDVGQAPPALQEGEAITNIEEVVDVDDFIRSIASAGTSMSKLITELNEALEQDDVRTSLKETLLNLSDISGALNDVIISSNAKLEEVLAQVGSLVGSLNMLLEANAGHLSNTMSNIDGLTAALGRDAPGLLEDLRATTSELRAILHDARPNINSFIQKANSIANKADSIATKVESVATNAERTLESLGEVSEKISRGEGTIGRLLRDDRLYLSLTNALGGIEQAVSTLNRFRTYITFQGEYMPEVSDGKGYFYVTLKPRDDKYYVVGVVGDPIGSVKVTETTTNGVTVVEEKVEKEVEFTAHFAKRYNKTALRIGLTESTLGFGADQFFMHDKIKLSFDAWDFAKDEYLSKSPHVRLGADYFVHKNVFLSGGYDNIFNDRRSLFFGGGMRFEDDDFKYIFGSLPSIPGN